MERRYAKKGLTLVAPEVQNSSPDAIKDLVKEHKIEYTVTQGIKGPSLGNGIPHMAVFDGTGKLTWVGHPMDKEAEDAIRGALRSASKSSPSSGESASGSGSSPSQKKAELIPLRTWTNTDGKQLEATLVSLDGTTGHFKRANGSAFDYDITKLSQPDQDAIQTAAASSAPAKSQ